MDFVAWVLISSLGRGFHIHLAFKAEKALGFIYAQESQGVGWCLGHPYPPSSAPLFVTPGVNEPTRVVQVTMLIPS